jgi:hypothetical protein
LSRLSSVRGITPTLLVIPLVRYNVTVCDYRGGLPGGRNLRVRSIPAMVRCIHDGLRHSTRQPVPGAIRLALHVSGHLPRWPRISLLCSVLSLWRRYASAWCIERSRCRRSPSESGMGIARQASALSESLIIWMNSAMTPNSPSYTSCCRPKQPYQSFAK